jgi:hypothetical protein
LKKKKMMMMMMMMITGCPDSKFRRLSASCKATLLPWNPGSRTYLVSVETDLPHSFACQLTLATDMTTALSTAHVHSSAVPVWYCILYFEAEREPRSCPNNHAAHCCCCCCCCCRPVCDAASLCFAPYLHSPLERRAGRLR